MIRRLPYYKNGAVRLEVAGKYPERFINFCIADRIYLWGVKQTPKGLVLWMSVDDFFRIRPAVRKSGVHIKVIRSYGLPFLLKKWKRRKVLSAGIVLFFVALYTLSSYIWFIEIDGLKSIDREKIEMTLSAQGLQRGAKRDLLDTKKIERALLVDFPELAWSGVHFTGTRAVVEVVEKVRPEIEDKSPADLIAAKDGIITECIAFQGDAEVKKGDAVKAGDVLIRGVSRSDQEMGADVRAKGIVKARIHYESMGEAKKRLIVYERTGEKDTALQVNLNGDVFTLREAQPEQYAAYEKEEVVKSLPWWRNRGFTVELIIDTYRELDFFETSLDDETAKERATAESLSMSKYMMPQDAFLLDSRTEVVDSPDDDTIRVNTYFETEEEIGVYPVKTDE